jgi:hypothetical protein
MFIQSADKCSDCKKFEDIAATYRKMNILNMELKTASPARRTEILKQQLPMAIKLDDLKREDISRLQTHFGEHCCETSKANKAKAQKSESEIKLPY